MAAPHAPHAPEPRNVLLLVGEDVGRQLGCWGDPIASTPHLDALAARGTRYTRAFSHSPVCSPSRASLATGVVPWELGTHLHRSRLAEPPEVFPRLLRDAGHRVCWCGKTDFNFEPAPGWRDTDAPWWEDPSVLLDGDRPFFAYRNLQMTHESGSWERVPADQLPPGAEPTDPAAVPVPPYLPDLPEVRREIANHYDRVALADAAVGGCLSALERTGRSADTLVVYLADHGRGLPMEKRFCYEAGIHLPLIVAGPSVPSAAVESGIVSWIDVAPTILARAGVAPPAAWRGRDFLASDWTPRAFHFAGRDRMDETHDRQRVARSPRHLYVRNHHPQISRSAVNRYQEEGSAAARAIRAADPPPEPPADRWLRPGKPAEELFDCEADPSCVVDLASSLASAGVLAAHRSALDEELRVTGDLGDTPEPALVAGGLLLPPSPG